jgi:chorismate synthase
MINTFGSNFVIKIFGESHGPEIGVQIEGVPRGKELDIKKLRSFLDRRAPGRSELSSGRCEDDTPEFLTGIKEGVFTGDPIIAVIKNKDVRSKDYSAFKNTPRPGHADFPAMVRAKSDTVPPGGGAFSGRMTAPLCIAGGIALQLLGERGIEVQAGIASIGGFTEEEQMREAVLKAKEAGDSLGGIISCTVTGLPVGVGEPMFDGLENKIAQAVFAIPAVKGIEFGAGFAAAGMKGSENNDEYFIREGGSQCSDIYTRTNNAGGILGGMSTGMPVELRVAVKPTPSIARPQRSVNMNSFKEEEIRVTGRHDPCIVPRAVPCVEAAVAIAVYDLLLWMEKRE